MFSLRAPMQPAKPRMNITPPTTMNSQTGSRPPRSVMDDKLDSTPWGGDDKKGGLPISLIIKKKKINLQVAARSVNVKLTFVGKINIFSECRIWRLPNTVIVADESKITVIVRKAFHPLLGSVWCLEICCWMNYSCYTEDSDYIRKMIMPHLLLSLRAPYQVVSIELNNLHFTEDCELLMNSGSDGEINFLHSNEAKKKFHQLVSRTSRRADLWKQIVSTGRPSSTSCHDSVKDTERLTCFPVNLWWISLKKSLLVYGRVWAWWNMTERDLTPCSAVTHIRQTLLGITNLSAHNARVKISQHSLTTTREAFFPHAVRAHTQSKNCWSDFKQKNLNYYLLWLNPAGSKLFNAANETQSHHYSFFSIHYSSFKQILTNYSCCSCKVLWGRAGHFAQFSTSRY